MATGARAGRHVPDAHATKRKHQVSCLRPSMSVEAYTLKRPELLLQTQEASQRLGAGGHPASTGANLGRGFFLISTDMQNPREHIFPGIED